MFRCNIFLAALLFCLPSLAADRPTLIITPSGVWQIDYVGDVPQAPRAVDYDVIVRGFSTSPGPTPGDPVPPVTDSPAVQAVATISKSVLKDASEATAVYAVIEALQGAGLTGPEFAERLSDFAGLIDTQVGAGGRITKWIDQVIAATKTPDGAVKASDLLTGLKRAFIIDKAAAELVATEAAGAPGTPITEQAIDFVKLIELIRLILDLIKTFRG